MLNFKIPFNKPYLTGNEISYIKNAVLSGKISGNGKYTKLCQNYLKTRYNFGECLLTTSCTDALEMAALIIGIEPGDEVIIPSYTFVSTANAFLLRGAKIVFADSRKDHPGIDEDKIEALITKNTKALVPVHYAGVACNMDKIMSLANKYNLYVIEDAAQAIDGYYVGENGEKRALGSIGHLAAFSFHETKNIISGEGGMLVINDDDFKKRAEIIWEKGTNRSAYFRGEVNKYNWIDIGSSFLPSDLLAAFLWAQIENLDEIQEKRKEIWHFYLDSLKNWSLKNNIILPYLPEYATNNAHMFYLICENLEQREKIISGLKSKGILGVFHYLSLHNSPFFIDKYKGELLENSNRYTKCILRLPFYYELENNDLNFITRTLLESDLK